MSTTPSPELIFCEKKALGLNAHDRAALATRLIASLDELTESENEALWVREAECRYEAYRNGNQNARPVSEAIRDLRSKLG